jgi:hypothetical protein
MKKTDCLGHVEYMRTMRTPGKETQYPLYRRLSEPMAAMDGCGKFRPHRDSIPQTIQPIESSYTVYTIPRHINRGEHEYRDRIQ